MSGFCFHAQQNRIFGCGFCLEGGDEFFGVSGDNTVVGIGRCNEDRRIVEASLDVVEGRISEKILELLGTCFCIAIFRYPVSPDSELVVP